MANVKLKYSIEALVNFYIRSGHCNCHLLFTILLSISIGYAGAVAAAPSPGTGTSRLTSLSDGYFLHRYGFRLQQNQAKEHKSVWTMTSGEEPTQNNPEQAEWVFVGSPEKQLKAQIKLDRLETEINIESFAKKSWREFSPLGFDLLGSKLFQQNSEQNSILLPTRGFVVDLKHRDKKIQLRQAFFIREKKLIVVTCSTPEKLFKENLTSCNELIKGFSWVASPENLEALKTSKPL